MAEGGFDPCECVCSHEYAMRRLLNLVRYETQVFELGQLVFNHCVLILLSVSSRNVSSEIVGKRFDKESLGPNALAVCVLSEADKQDRVPGNTSWILFSVCLQFPSSL